MNKAVLRLYLKLATPHYVSLFFVLILVIINLFPFANRTFSPKEETMSVVPLELAYTKVKFSEIVTHWFDKKGADQTDADVIRNFKFTTGILDTAFPIVYALLLASVLALLTTQLYKSPNQFHKLLFASPFVAAVFDLLENISFIAILWNVRSRIDLENIPAPLVFSASLFASLKFIILGIVICYILYYFIVAWLRHLFDI